MPIKFACPKCKNVMSVADNLAGKNGKCKCGNKVTVPVSSSPTVESGATSPANVPAAALFDALTESDFSRESPFAKSGGSSHSANDASTLKRFTVEQEEQQQAKAGVAKTLMVVIAILNFLLAGGCIAVVVFFSAFQDIISRLTPFVPEVSLGNGPGIAFFATAAIVLIAAGVGMLMKTKWGWCMAASVFTYLCVERVAALGMVLTNGFEQGPFFAAMVPMVAVLALTSFVFQAEMQQIVKVKTSVPAIVAALLGIAIAAGVLGGAYSISKNSSGTSQTLNS